MSKKVTWAILALMTVGLVGLVHVQVHYLHKTATLKELLFRASVNRALNTVAQRLEATEAQNALSRSLHSVQYARTTATDKPATALSTRMAAINAASRRKFATTKPSSSKRDSSSAVSAAQPQPNEPFAHDPSKPLSLKPLSVPLPPAPALPPQPEIVVQSNGQTFRLVLPQIPFLMRDCVVSRVRHKMANKAPQTPQPPSESRSLPRLPDVPATRMKRSYASSFGDQPERAQETDARRTERIREEKKTLREMMDYKESKDALEAQRKAWREWQDWQRAQQMLPPQQKAQAQLLEQLGEQFGERLGEQIFGQFGKSLEQLTPEQFARLRFVRKPLSNTNANTNAGANANANAPDSASKVDKRRRTHRNPAHPQSLGVGIRAGDSVMSFALEQTPSGFAFTFDKSAKSENRVSNSKYNPSNKETEPQPFVQLPEDETSAARTKHRLQRSAQISSKQQPEHERDTLQKIVNSANLLEKALEDMTLRRRSIGERVSIDDLETLLSRALKENDIRYGFEFGIKRELQDSLVMLKASFMPTGMKPLPNASLNTSPDKKLLASEFRTRLFPNDFASEPYQLVVRFPDYKPVSIFSFSPVLISSSVCMLLIVGCFGFTLFAMVRQKKLSDMKTDFINNMTHELKTPIATISIASEALKDQQIRANAPRVERFVGIIHEENKRLAGHVEKVLQAAQMERGDLKLTILPTDIHAIIASAAESLALQVEQKNGAITFALNATQSNIEADEAHITNVVFNLLDNANKYSPASPCITISTEATAKDFVFRIRDNGIGISKDAQKHVFEKFYRVPTGNVHDVKGFGLGLSYVKSVVEAHDGSISVDSDVGKGSCFEVRLPLVRSHSLFPPNGIMHGSTKA